MTTLNQPEHPYPPHKVPEPVKVEMPPYVGNEPHPFNHCYGFDDLCVQLDRRFKAIEARLDKIEKFIDERLDYFKEV